jgi:membrane protease YdiL (CAAX protease family)
MPVSARSRIAAFLVLTCALSAPFYFRIAADGKMKMLPTLGLMWCPGVAALVVRLVTQRNLRGMGWVTDWPRWLVVSYLVPPALGLVVYGLVWLSGIGGFNPSGMVLDPSIHMGLPQTVALLVTVGVLSGVFFTLGEEIGWRGFLVPELARVTTFTRTAVISGAAWSIYHYPLILFSDYHGAAPKAFALVVFTWMIVASSFVYAWLRLKSGTVWTGVILHASHNLFVQQIFDPLTIDRGRTTYVTTEFGVGLALAYTLVALYFWRRRGEVSAGPAAAR